MGRERERRRGIALLLALVIGALLAIIVTEMRFSTRVDYRQAARFADDSQRELAVDSALLFAEIVLRRDKTDGEDRAYDSLEDAWNNAVFPASVGDASITITVHDEASKFNLLNLASEDEDRAAQQKEIFVRLCSIVRQGAGSEDYEGIADAILSYMDEVKRFNPEDEEDSWDGAPILTVDELLEVEEVTEDFLYGEPEPDEPGIARVPGMYPFLTVWSTGRININTAPSEMVEALHPAMTPEMAAAVLDYRQSEDDETGRIKVFRGKRQVLDVEELEALSDPEDPQSPTVGEEILSLITTRSSFFSVEVEASTGFDDQPARVRAIYKRVGSQVFRLLLDRIPQDRRPLAPGGVELQ